MRIAESLLCGASPTFFGRPSAASASEQQPAAAAATTSTDSDGSGVLVDGDLEAEVKRELQADEEFELGMTEEELDAEIQRELLTAGGGEAG